jgi:hypothetical protein
LTAAGTLAANGGTITATSGSEIKITIGNLDMASGATIDVASGTINETDSGFGLEGTFTINGGDWATWDSGIIAAQSLPFSEDFEKYALNSKASGCGLYGWGANSSNAVVQSSVYHDDNHAGSKALILPDGTSASNKINNATGSIWTEYYLRPTLGDAPVSVDATGKSFMSYVNTNGYMAVYTTNGDWVTCSSKLATNNTFTGGAPAAFDTNSFRRVAIYQDFTKGEFALFIGNASGTLELVAQERAFPGTQTYLNHFIINNADNNAYIDDITISTTAPTGSADLDGDGMLDVEEISHNGSTLIYPGGKGTIFRFI